MKLNFKRIASVIASTVMLSSTIAFAAAANYPAPFVNSGNADVAVVYGSNPGAEFDLLAVADITQNLQTALAKQTATGGTSTSASASGGDSVNLGVVGSQKLYMNSSINAGITTLTATELPTLLADGTATDQAGTAYKYTHKLQLSTNQVTFSKSGENIDPIPLVNIGTSTSGTPILNYTLTFSKTINLSDTTNVVGAATIKIFGQDYTIGANSDSTANLYLIGSGTPVNIDEGATKNVTFQGIGHTVSLKGASSTTVATIIVDGVSRSVTKGASYQFPGAFNIYVRDVFYTTKTGTLSNVDLLLGSQALHFVNGGPVRYGADDTTITNTVGNLAYSGGLLSYINIAQAAEQTIGDYVPVGGAFTERVFKGLKLNFAGLNPGLNNTAARTTVKVDADNALNSKVTFTTDLSGKEYSLNYAHDADNVGDTALSVVRLADAGNFTIVVQEGSNISLSGYTVINGGDKSRILRLDSVGSGTSTSDKTSFTDAITGESFSFTTGTANTGSLNIDGTTYYVAAVNTSTGTPSANLTWGTSAAAGNPGSSRVLFPKIKLKGGSWMAVLASTSVDNVTTYALPGVDSLSTYESGAVLSGYNPAPLATGFNKYGNYTATTVGKAVWNATWMTNLTNAGASVSNGTLDAVVIQGTNCNFNATLGPAILIQEERTSIGSASTNGELVCIPLTREGSTTITPAVGSPVFTDGTSISNSLASNTNLQQTVNVFGTLVQYDTSDANRASAWVPFDQMTADVLVNALATTVSAGTSAGSGTVKELGSVSVRDSEVSQVSTKNLIVVGGSCVNKLASELLSGAGCGSSWEQATGVGAGSFLIQSFDRTGGKVATLVAGYNADDTRNAAKVLTAGAVDTMAGKKYKSTSATTVSLVTAA